MVSHTALTLNCQSSQSLHRERGTVTVLGGWEVKADFSALQGVTKIRNKFHFWCTFQLAYQLINSTRWEGRRKLGWRRCESVRFKPRMQYKSNVLKIHFTVNPNLNLFLHSCDTEQTLLAVNWHCAPRPNSPSSPPSGFNAETPLSRTWFWHYPTRNRFYWKETHDERNLLLHYTIGQNTTSHPRCHIPYLTPLGRFLRLWTSLASSTFNLKKKHLT